MLIPPPLRLCSMKCDRLEGMQCLPNGEIILAPERDHPLRSMFSKFVIAWRHGLFTQMPFFAKYGVFPIRRSPKLLTNQTKLRPHFGPNNLIALPPTPHFFVRRSLRWPLFLPRPFLCASPFFPPPLIKSHHSVAAGDQQEEITSSFVLLVSDCQIGEFGGSGWCWANHHPSFQFPFLLAFSPSPFWRAQHRRSLSIDSRGLRQDH